MSDLIAFLVDILFWPSSWWRKHNDDSRLGTSPMEEGIERFWFKVGLAGVVVVGIGYGVYQLWSGDV